MAGNKLKEIYTGWKNVVVTDEVVEALAKERMEKCNACPYKIIMLKMEVCELCHCPLIAKTRSLETECPKGFWSK